MAWPPVTVAAARLAADATSAGVVATGAWALEWERAKLGFGNAAKLTSYHEAHELSHESLKISSILFIKKWWEHH